jgi:ketosteroid isomerase-like protein
MRHLVTAPVLMLIVSVAPLFAQGGPQAAIVDLRSRIAAAARAKDAAVLGALFTDDFTHTHVIGRVDGKAQRVKSLMGTADTIETVPPAEIAIRFYGLDTAIAVGRSMIGDDAVRWTSVYVRREGRWMAAASHASAIE